MKLLLCFLTLAGFCAAASLDVEALGHDLNGWDGDVARYGKAGAAFEAERPTLATDAAGNLVVTTVIRERKGRSAVFKARLRALISLDGFVRSLSIDGEVDGRSFEAGEVTRPEPVIPPVADGETPGDPTVADVAPVDPQKEMRASLGQNLSAAIERARSSDKVVKRDLSAWIFSSRGSSAEILAEGVDAVVRAIFRHSRN